MVINFEPFSPSTVSDDAGNRASAPHTQEADDEVTRLLPSTRRAGSIPAVTTYPRVKKRSKTTQLNRLLLSTRCEGFDSQHRPLSQRVTEVRTLLASETNDRSRENHHRTTKTKTLGHTVRLSQKRLSLPGRNHSVHSNDAVYCCLSSPLQKRNWWVCTLCIIWRVA